MEKLQTAACYIRVSTDDQTEYSPDSQKKLIMEYAAAHSLALPEEFIFMEQEGVSGRIAEKRPEFQRMIGAAKGRPRPFDVILVWKYSRFARNQEESIVYKSMLKRECGVQVVSISEPLSDGPFGGLIERIIEWMDEYYSIRLSGEVCRGMKEAASRGFPVNGTPYGYLRRNRKLLPDPERLDIVKKIFLWYRLGQSCGEIAAKLNEMGICSRKGNPFESRAVRYILQNPAYIGKLRWGGNGWIGRDFDRPDIEVFDGNQEPVIDPETWEAVQQRLREERKAMPPNRRQKVRKEYFLRGFLRCSSCGGVLTYSGSGGVQCANYNRKACKHSHYISIRQAQECVLEALKEDFSGCPCNVCLEISPRGKEDETPALNTRLQQERQRLRRALDAYQAGVDSLREYRENKQAIQNRIAALERETAQSKEQESAGVFCRRARLALDVILSPDSTEEEKNKALGSFVDRIVFDRAANILTIYYYL